MNSPTYRIAAGLAAAVVLVGCADPISDVSFESVEPEFAAPLVSTTFTLRDAIGDTDFADNFEEDEDSGLRIAFSQRLFDITPAASLSVPNLKVPLTDSVTNYNLSEEGIEVSVTNVDFTGGGLSITFTNILQEDVLVVVESPTFQVNDRPLLHEMTVPADATASDTIALSGMKVDFGDEGVVDIAYRARTASGTPVEFPIGAIGLVDNDFSYAEGTLTALDLSLGTDSIFFDALNAFEEGQVELVDIDARFTFVNEIGVPFRVATPVAFATSRSDKRMAFNSPFGSGIDIAYPTVSEGLTPKTTEIIINQSTSNLVDVVNSLPTKVVFDLTAQANSDTLTDRFFIHEEARLSGQFDMDLPLAVRFKGFELDQEFAFDGSSLEDAQAAALRLEVDNAFGLTAKVQVYFYDRTGATLDSLFDSHLPIIESAEVNDVGATLTKTNKVTDVELSREKMNVLRQASDARAEIKLESPNGGSGVTRLYYDNEISFKLGARITVKPF